MKGKNKVRDILISLKSGLKPKFYWWRGNVFDTLSLVKILFVISLFLPILPWEKRKQGNYSLHEKLYHVAKAANRDTLNVEALSARYKASIPDSKLRECIIARNIVLTMVADDAVMQSSFRSLPPSNVPFVFLFDAITASVLDMIATPNFSGVIQKVANKCEPFPGEYLNVKDVAGLKSKDLPRGSFWELF